MVPSLLNLNFSSVGLTKDQSQDRFFRMPRWVWVLGLFLIVVIVGIIIKLREEEEIAEKGWDTGTVPPPPTPEPTKPAVEAESIPPSAEIDTEVQPPVKATAAPPDNLKLVNGIGPQIETLLNENGITTLAQLAETEVSRLQALVVEAGWEKLADPTTWPEQARNLAEEQ